MIQVTAKTREAYHLLHQGTLALARAEAQGIRVDVDYLETKKAQLTKKVEKMEEKLKKSDFYKTWKKSTKGREPNMYSDQQLASYLYDYLDLEPSKTTETGKGSTDEEALLDLNIEELKTLIRIKKFKKMRDTYLEGFAREQVNGYIHPFFNLHLVTTFRSSSDRPNFQNIPKRDKELMKLTRKALYPRPGHQLLEIDYSGLEVAIAACYHKDPKMIQYIEDPSTDMHGDMAEQLFKIKNFDRKIPEHSYLRSASKNAFVFPQFYGDYYKNCAEGLAGKWGQLPQGKWKPSQGVLVEEGLTLGEHLISQGIKSMAQYTEFVKKIEEDFWSNRFPVYSKWKDTWWELYQKHGYVSMNSGFTCLGPMSRNDCINYPVQGSAFHCLLWSFIELDRISRERQWKTKLIGQIHDAIIFDVHPEELNMVLRVVKDITTVKLPEAWKWIIVPLSVDAELCPVDAPWCDKEEIDMPKSK